MAKKRKGVMSWLFGGGGSTKAETRAPQAGAAVDDQQRTWRPDAKAYMTDWEYVDWYENYYFDLDEPY